jgi:hypothetical protein
VPASTPPVDEEDEDDDELLLDEELLVVVPLEDDEDVELLVVVPLEEVELVLVPGPDEDVVEPPASIVTAASVPASPSTKSPSRPAIALQAARPITLHPIAAPRRISIHRTTRGGRRRFPRPWYLRQ